MEKDEKRELCIVRPFNALTIQKQVFNCYMQTDFGFEGNNTNTYGLSAESKEL